MPQTIIGPDDPALNVMQSALAAQPGLDTELVIIPWAEYRDRLLTTLTAQKAHHQAVFIPGHVWLPELATDGRLAVFDDLINTIPRREIENYNFTDILPTVAEESGYQGRQYMLPFFTDGHILFYRSDIFEFDDSEGVPEVSPLDLESMVAATHKPPDVYGLALKAHPSEIFLDWLPFLWAAGGDVLDENLQLAFAGESGNQALEAYCRLRQYCPPETHDYGNAEIANVLRTGKAVFVTTWGGQAAPIFLDSQNNFREKYKAAVFSKPWNATWGIAIPANQPSSDQRDIFQVLLSITGSDQDQEIIQAAGSPVRRSSHTKAAFAQYPWLEAQRRMLDQSGRLPIRPETAKILGVLSEAVYAVFCGKMSTEQALLDAKIKAQDRLHGN